MKRCCVMLLSLMLLLSACGAPMAKDPAGRPSSAAETPEEVLPETPEEDCGYQLSQGDNVVEHEEAVYCGNTVTTVSREERVWDEPWEASFWGGDSVALTDLLRYLDYSGDICRCLPEYNVDTEFGTGYGINLTEGYVRHDGGQSPLTEEQMTLIRDILERQTGEE